MAVMNLTIQINNTNNNNNNITDCDTLRTAIIMSKRMQPIVDRRARSQRRINATFVTWLVLIYRMFIRRSKLMAKANQLPRKVSLQPMLFQNKIRIQVKSQNCYRLKGICVQVKWLKSIIRRFMRNEHFKRHFTFQWNRLNNNEFELIIYTEKVDILFHVKLNRFVTIENAQRNEERLSVHRLRQFHTLFSPSKRDGLPQLGVPHSKRNWSENRDSQWQTRCSICSLINQLSPIPNRMRYKYVSRFPRFEKCVCILISVASNGHSTHCNKLPLKCFAFALRNSERWTWWNYIR